MTNIRFRNLLVVLLFLGQFSQIQAQLVGNLERIETFPSDHVLERRVDLWTPEKSEGPYTLLIMHDGQMLFQSDSTWNKQEWGVDECLDSLIAQKRIPNVMVVGIWNLYEHRHRNYFPQKPFESLGQSTQDSLLHLKKNGQDAALFSAAPNSDDYLRFIFEELLPYIKEHYSIRENEVYMMGSSMGGLISMYAALEYPSQLKGVACLSTHWPGVWQNEANPIPDAFLEYMAKHQAEAEQSKWYFDRGDATLDSLYQPHQDRVDVLINSWDLKPRQFQSLAIPGAAHREIDWRERLPQILLFLLGS